MIRAAIAVLALPAALALAGGGCSSDSRPSGPTARAASPAPSAATPDRLDTDLPPHMPERFEVELRRRTPKGDDTVLKLTPAGARYGLARGKSRVSLRFMLPPGTLGTVYQTLREESFDRIESGPSAQAPLAGSSLRVTAGPGRYSASAMGRSAPVAEHAAAYAHCVEIAGSLLPQGHGETVVRVHWHESIGDHAASLDINADPGFVGIHRAPGSRPDVELHLERPRPLSIQLRHGTPPRSETHTIEAGRDHGLEVAYDPEQQRVVLRPMAAAPAGSTP